MEMASSFVLTIGGNEIDSNKRYVTGECVDIFTPEDRVTIEGEEGGEFLYRVKIPLLVSRLEDMGFTLDNCREALKELKAEVDSEVDFALEGEEESLLTEFGRKYSEFQKYIHKINIEDIVQLLDRCKKFEHPYYPDLGKHDLLKNELVLLDVLFNRGYFSQMFDETYFHPFNTYRLLAEAFSEEDEFVIDYSDLVHAGYYEDDELPIKEGYNSTVQNRSKDALIKGQFLDGHKNDENRTIEYKEVTSNNPVSAIKKALPKYVLGYLNALGGTVLWGVTDGREVAGVKINNEQRDKLKRNLYSALDDFEPSVVKELFQINFRPVIHDGRELEDTFCIELTVPKGENDHMYFTRSGKTWVRLDGITKALKGHELYKYIANKHK